MAIRHPRHHLSTIMMDEEEETALFSVPKLNDVDLMAIENVAELCLHTDKVIRDGCDLDQYDALVHRLQAQRAMMLDQVEYMDDLLRRLQGNTAFMMDVAP